MEDKEKEDQNQDEIQLFLDSIDLLAQKDRTDEDFELMKKAVSGIWANIATKE